MSPFRPSLLAAALLAACGGAPGDTSDPDAGATPAADARTGMIVVHTRAPDDDIVISNPDGSLREHLRSDGSGIAHATIEAGDWVTVFSYDGSARDVHTSVGVQPGDDLGHEITDDPLVPRGRIDLDLTPLPPGATTAWVSTPCSNAEHAPWSVATCTHLRADVIAVAFDAPPVRPGVHALGFAAQGNVPDGAHVALGPWAPMGTVHVEVTDPVAPHATFTPWIWPVSDGGLPFSLPMPDFWEAVYPMPSGADVPYVRGIGIGWELELSSESDAGRQLFGERHPGEAPATIAIDAAGELPHPPRDLALTSADSARPAVAWHGNEGLGDGGVEAFLSFSDEDVERSWTMELPAGTTSFRLPALPPELADLAPSSSRPVSLAEVDVIESTRRPWDDLRNQIRRPIPPEYVERIAVASLSRGVAGRLVAAERRARAVDFAR
ncbi:MAG TPA: hypothetical protein VHE35_22480 [Kofleriaceae bacterium]|nr:hypothetical protein [Kofleriaceae bacterium]